MVIIPTRTDMTAYTETVNLAGTVYRLTLRWNTRGEFWTMDIADSSNEILVAGIKLVPDWPLIALLTDADLPAGQIIAFDTSGQGEKPGETDLGDRVLLLFSTEAEIAAL